MKHLFFLLLVTLPVSIVTSPIDKNEKNSTERTGLLLQPSSSTSTFAPDSIPNTVAKKSRPSMRLIKPKKEKTCLETCFGQCCLPIICQCAGAMLWCCDGDRDK